VARVSLSFEHIGLHDTLDWPSANESSGKHVVFGEIVSGLDVVKTVEQLGNKEGKIPSKDKLAVIKDCGAVAV
jgi:cyclophilin family peptidyl-prolyl cis-trans isomerase